MRRALKPDSQAFDQVMITTEPRFKESELSGSEWRISARIELMRKGTTIHTARFRDVETAVNYLASVWHGAIDDGRACFAGEEDFCDQEGCQAKATVFYRVKKEYCNAGIAHESPFPNDTYRAFCTEHADRGDQSFDDSMRNYEKLDGQPR